MSKSTTFKTLAFTGTNKNGDFTTYPRLSKSATAVISDLPVENNDNGDFIGCNVPYLQPEKPMNVTKAPMTSTAPISVT